MATVESWLTASVAEVVAESTNTAVRVARAAGEFAVAVTSITTDADGGVTTVTVARHVSVADLPDVDAGTVLVKAWAAPAIGRDHGKRAMSVEFAEAMEEAEAEAVKPKGEKP